MRGLRLFVKEIGPSDHPAVRAFLDAEVWSRLPAGPRGGAPEAHTTPAFGLVGKLLGDIVAVASLEVTPEAVRVDDIIVARDLRRKRIGRVMLSEIEQLAAKMDRRRIVVDDARDVGEFFRRLGFRSEGERWVRDLLS